MWKVMPILLDLGIDLKAKNTPDQEATDKIHRIVAS